MKKIYLLSSGKTCNRSEYRIQSKVTMSAMRSVSKSSTMPVNLNPPTSTIQVRVSHQLWAVAWSHLYQALTQIPLHLNLNLKVPAKSHQYQKTSPSTDCKIIEVSYNLAHQMKTNTYANVTLLFPLRQLKALLGQKCTLPAAKLVLIRTVSGFQPTKQKHLAKRSRHAHV